MTNFWTILISLISGGAGLKVLEMFFSLNKSKLDEAASIRKELREENALLRTAIADVNRQIAEWREKYFVLQKRFTELEADHNINKNELARLTAHLKEMEIYKSQSELIKRMTLELEAYETHRDPQLLIDNLRKELELL